MSAETPVGSVPGVALIVRSLSYRQRSARAQLDVALLAAAVECPLQLYFVGGAALQLLARRDTVRSLLPPGYRAWASLPELTEVRVFAEPEWLELLHGRGVELLLQPTAMDARAMQEDWRACGAVLVL